MTVVLVVAIALAVEAVVLTVAVKSLVWAGDAIDMLLEMYDVRADVMINMVDAVAIVLGFAASVSSSADMLSDVVFDLLVDAFADARAAIIIGALPDIDIALLLGVKENAFVVVVTLKFVMPAPSEGFSCGAAIDCRSMAALDCAHVLQARMPSYHV